MKDKIVDILETYWGGNYTFDRTVTKLSNLFSSKLEHLEKEIRELYKPFPDVRHKYEVNDARLIEARIESFNKAIDEVLALIQKEKSGILSKGGEEG